MDKIKINYFSAYLNKGGANKACNNLFYYARKNINDFNITRTNFYDSKNPKFKTKLMRLVGKLISLPTKQSQCYVPFILKNVEKDRIFYDIVHAHWLNNIPLNSIPNCRSLVLTAHDQWLFNTCWAWDPNYLKSPTRKIENKISTFIKSINSHNSALDIINELYPLKKIITPSSWLKEYILSKTNFQRSKIQVIKNIIDQSKFKYNIDENKSFHNNQKKLVIVASTAYWQEWRKGKTLLFEILKKIIKITQSNVIFKIIGKLEVDNEIKNHSILYGNLNDKNKIASILNTANCMIMPSRLENLTQTICEALFCGLPVLAFDVGGNSEIITDKSLGNLITYPNVSNFIDPIMDIYLKENYMNRKIRSITAKKAFCNSEIIKQHLNLYKKLK